VRFSLLVASLLVLVGSGCYSPGIKNKGFACNPQVEPPCPSGFFCVDGLCQDKPGTSSGGIGGVGSDGGAPDLSTSMHGGDFDFSMPSAADQSMAPPDLAKPMCLPANSACLVDTDCCSHKCTTLFGCEQ
jgi:hypothetical protein